MSGTAEYVEYQLSTNITVAEESIAVLDTVVIPTTRYTVTKDINDIIFARVENATEDVLRVATISPGYYDVNSLATAIAEALTRDSVVSSAYACSYDATIGRYVIRNAWAGPAEVLYLLSEQSLLANGDPD